MHAEAEKKSPAKATGKRFSSVADLMKKEELPPDVTSKYAELANSSKVVDQLSLLRQRAGITQEEMARRLGVTQSAISKLESGSDDDLTLAAIREYVKATDQRVGIVFGRPMNHVESVKAYAVGIKQHLSALANLSHQGEDLEQAIQAFFGEAFFNLLNILAVCHGEMPNGKEFEIRFQALEPIKQKVHKGKSKELIEAELNTV